MFAVNLMSWILVGIMFALTLLVLVQEGCYVVYLLKEREFGYALLTTFYILSVMLCCTVLTFCLAASGAL